MKEAAQIHQLCERFWHWRMVNFPEFATLVGEHRYDYMLNDFSLDAFKKRKQEAIEILNEVQSLRKYFEDIGRQVTSYNDLELLQSQLKTFVNGTQHKAYLCPVNKLEGPQFDFCRVLQHMRKDTANDFDTILIRLTILPKQIDQIIDLMKEGIKAKTILHEHSISPVPNQLRNLANETFWNSPIAKCFAHQPEVISDFVWKCITEKAERITTNQINPSLIKLADFVSDHYLKYTRVHIGLNCLPNGKAMYKSCLRYHTSSEMTAEEIHAVGVKEVKRIHQRMCEVMEGMDFDGKISDFQKRLDSHLCYTSAQEILTDYTNKYNRITEKLPQIFNALSMDDCCIKSVPKEQEGISVHSFYKEGSENRGGVFYVNTQQPKLRGKYKSMALVLHETIPGHHLQSEIFLRKKDTAKFRRFVEGGNYQMIPGRFPLYTAFMEGWGLYSEYLGEEMKLYENGCDLYGRLRSEMLRAARLVVDTGVHAFNWNKTQAVAYIMEYVGLSLASASDEVDRYITWPGQACAYKIGELKFIELRQHAMQCLKGKFDLKEFHDVVLNNGAVSMSFVEKQVDAYIFKNSSQQP